MSVTPGFLIGRILQAGAKEVLTDFEGTDEEAIEQIKEDGVNHYTIGDCDNQADDGACNGHSK
jgi:hypothetical protein